MIIKLRSLAAIAIFIIAIAAVHGFAQSPPPATDEPQASGTDRPSPAAAAENDKKLDQTSLRRQTNFRNNFFRDQKAIWSSPFKLKRSDLKVIIPFAAITAALIATDRRTSGWVKDGGTLRPISHDIGMAAASSGIIAFGSYLIGRSTGNQRLRETGILAVEAILDTGVVTGVTKTIFRRPRPNMDDGRGRFFRGGYSFPSGHSAYSWTVATVIANEYDDKPLIKYGAYGLAAAISLSRYTGRTHFLSEVVVGSAIGFSIGRFVFRRHHSSLSSPAGSDAALGNGSVSLMPRIVPYYDRRTATYGGRLLWSF